MLPPERPKGSQTHSPGAYGPASKPIKAGAQFSNYVSEALQYQESRNAPERSHKFTQS